MNNTITLSFSYFFRGFITIYYIISFTKLYAESADYLFLAPAGLLLSRFTEGFLTLIFMSVFVPDTAQLIVSAVMFIPMLMVFVKIQNDKYVIPPIFETKRVTIFCEKYQLTNREKKILVFLAKGLSDSEIADQLFISKYSQISYFQSAQKDSYTIKNRCCKSVE